MKLKLITSLLVLTASLQSHATFKNNPPPPPPPPVREAPVSVDQCAANIYQAVQVGVKLSTAESACSIRTDRSFQTCVVEVTQALRKSYYTDKEVMEAAQVCRNTVGSSLLNCADLLNGRYLNNNYFDQAIKFCQRAPSKELAVCIGELYQGGGLYPQQTKDECAAGLSQQAIQCVQQKYAQTGRSNSASLAACRQENDPGVLARRQAEEKARRDAIEKAQREAREAQERARQQQEQARRDTEDRERYQKEQARLAQERARLENEALRQRNESERLRQQAEAQRIQAEQVRLANERARLEAEQARQRAEAERARQQQQAQQSRPTPPAPPAPPVTPAPAPVANGGKSQAEIDNEIAAQRAAKYRAEKAAEEAKKQQQRPTPQPQQPTQPKQETKLTPPPPPPPLPGKKQQEPAPKKEPVKQEPKQEAKHETKPEQKTEPVKSGYVKTEEDKKDNANDSGGGQILDLPNF